MKTTGKTRRDPDMLDEYDFSNGIRGKHVKRLMGGSNIVVQPPDAVKVFAKKRKCDNCGKVGAMQKRITRIYGRGENALVIENVPVIVCPHWPFFDRTDFSCGLHRTRFKYSYHQFSRRNQI